uniref:Uncharacterized protein n=1 Tax=Romanomermis culicivorax TaxID=13658 RepID=A0A915IGS8_ROMCU
MANNNINKMAMAEEQSTAKGRGAQILAPIDRRPKLAEDHIGRNWPRIILIHLINLKRNVFDNLDND